eukprot:3843629-Amphidinium_carterae.1
MSPALVCQMLLLASGTPVPPCRGTISNHPTCVHTDSLPFDTIQEQYLVMFLAMLHVRAQKKKNKEQHEKLPEKNSLSFNDSSLHLNCFQQRSTRRVWCRKNTDFLLRSRFYNNQAR